MLRTMSGPSLAGRSPPITMRTFPATLPTAGHWPRSHSGSTYIREDKIDENKVMQATEPVMATIALIIDRMVRHNDQLGNNCGCIFDTIFQTAPAPISIHDYILRISRHLSCSNECIIVGLMYIDRVMDRFPEFLLTSLNVHRMLITSIMLAKKFFDDAYHNNSYFAKVGGVACEELNQMELKMLFLLDFDLSIAPDKFNLYEDAFQDCVPKQPAQAHRLHDDSSSRSTGVRESSVRTDSSMHHVKYAL